MSKGFIDEAEMRHPALVADPSLIAAVVAIRVCGYDWQTANRKYDYRKLSSERALARMMSERCGGTDDVHRKRLKKLRQAGLYDMINGVPTIDFGSTGPNIEEEFGSTGPNIGSIGPSFGSTGPNIGSTGPREMDVFPAQVAFLAPCIVSSVSNVSLGEAEGKDKSMTIGADPDKARQYAQPRKFKPAERAERPRTAEVKTNLYQGSCHRCGSLVPAGEGRYLEKDSEGKPIIQCMGKCEDVIGKKAARHQAIQSRQKQVTELAQKAPDENHREALFELNAALDTRGSKYASFSELVEADPTRISMQYGEEAFDYAVQSLFHILGGTK